MRNFTSNMLPISTAMWNAFWFKGIDCIDDLILPGQIIEQLERNKTMCSKNCPFTAPCEFMKQYKLYLDTLNFDEIINKLNNIAKRHKNIDTIVLMVYEKTTVNCAERPVLQQWFREHGIELEEWQKPSVKTSALI